LKGENASGKGPNSDKHIMTMTVIKASKRMISRTGTNLSVQIDDLNLLDRFSFKVTNMPYFERYKYIPIN
jgi:hypothetical protein